MLRLLFVVTALTVFAGCQKPESAKSKDEPAGPKVDTTDDVTAERVELSPEDRALVDAQEWCVVSTDERLGSMGPPLKLDINGQVVFVCCKGCKRKAEADPDKTLAKLAELKIKKAAGASR